MQQKPIQRYNYTSYGRTRIEKTRVGAKLVVSPYGFTGRELDFETGDYYYRARYYDAWTGRFLSEDPIGFGGGDESLYRYVRNNPAVYKDPEGKNLLLFGFAAVCVGIAANWVVYDLAQGEKGKIIPAINAIDDWAKKNFGDSSGGGGSNSCGPSDSPPQCSE